MVHTALIVDSIVASATAGLHEQQRDRHHEPAGRRRRRRTAGSGRWWSSPRPWSTAASGGTRSGSREDTPRDRRRPDPVGTFAARGGGLPPFLRRGNPGHHRGACCAAPTSSARTWSPPLSRALSLPAHPDDRRVRPAAAVRRAGRRGPGHRVRGRPQPGGGLQRGRRRPAAVVGDPGHGRPATVAAQPGADRPGRRAAWAASVSSLCPPRSSTCSATAGASTTAGSKAPGSSYRYTHGGRRPPFRGGRAAAPGRRPRSNRPTATRATWRAFFRHSSAVVRS